MGKCNSIAVHIPNYEGICGLIDGLGQPFSSASLQHADEVRDYTTDLNEIEQDWDSIVDLFIHSGFGGNKPSTVVDLFGNTPDIIHQGGRFFYNKKTQPEGCVSNIIIRLLAIQQQQPSPRLIDCRIDLILEVKQF